MPLLFAGAKRFAGSSVLVLTLATLLSSRDAVQGGFEVTGGRKFCEVDSEGCIHDGVGKYGNKEYCTFVYIGTTTLERKTWNVEWDYSCWYDYLQVNGGRKYCGWDASSKAFPSSMSVSGRTEFVWRTDFSVISEGFRICPETSTTCMFADGHHACELHDEYSRQYGMTREECKASCKSDPACRGIDFSYDRCYKYRKCRPVGDLPQDEAHWGSQYGAQQSWLETFYKDCAKCGCSDCDEWGPWLNYGGIRTWGCEWKQIRFKPEGCPHEEETRMVPVEGGCYEQNEYGRATCEEIYEDVGQDCASKVRSTTFCSNASGREECRRSCCWYTEGGNGIFGG